ncbi:FlgD immunoglobulin-like domain containing protein [Microbulbifer sp. SSSA007]|uniref:FlgD immunoglobulin-like domain containing protein n=1 Tax=Microbulbifer sp. SSSA007 TaxID=3243379 RepID=UPI00403A592E
MIQGRLREVTRRSFFTGVAQLAKAGLLAVFWMSIAGLSVGTQAEVLLYPVSERVYSPDLYISGLSAQPNEAIDIELNGTTVAQTRSNATREFALVVALAAGDNRIRALNTVSAETSNLQNIQYAPVGEADHIGTQLQVRSDIVAPLLNPPTADSQTNPITLSGIAEPGSTVSFFVNGRVTRSINADDSGVFSTWVPLEDGDNAIYAIAETDAGQSVASNSVATSYTNTLAREWSGDLPNTLVWTKGDGSPYVLNDDLNISANITLWIQPGVEVVVDGNHKLIIAGHLQVVGFSEELVQFKPSTQSCNGTSTQRSDWRGIEIVAGATAAIDYAEVHCATNGIYFNGGDGSVRNSELLYNSTGIYTYGESAGAHIAPEIIGNTIRGGTNGIYVNWNSDPQISGGNIITGNKYGIYAWGDVTYAVRNPIPVVTGNSLYNNSSHNYYTVNFNYQFSINLDARGNWWGTDSPDLIAQKIYDRTDKSSYHLPFVDYRGFLNGPEGEPAYAGEALLGYFTEDTYLSEASYLVLGSVEVVAGATLSISAGTALQFTGNYPLLVEGVLTAQGSETSPISFKPTAVACNDTNSSRSDWQGIEVAAGGVATIEYAEIHCAANGIYFNGGDGSVRNSELLYNSTGIYTYGESAGAHIAPEITGNTIRGGTNGIYVNWNSDPQISGGNVITGNKYGIYARGDVTYATRTPIPVVTGNSLYNNSSYNYYTENFNYQFSISLDARGNWWGTDSPDLIAQKIYDRTDKSSSHLPFVDYRGFLNGPEGEPAYAGEALLGYFTEDTYLSEASYLVLGSVEVVAGATLSISAGTALQFTGNYPLLVEGVLTAQGSETSPISFKPTAVACNDTNSSRSDWQGIEVAAGGVATIEYAEIHCAANGIYFNGGDGSVRNSELLYNSTGIYTYGESAGAHIAPEITGNTIRGGTNGIYVNWNSDPQISGGNVITGNKYGIYARGDLTYATRTPIPVVTGNSLYNNSSYNYYTENFNYQFSISLDARGNWWGTDSPDLIAQKIYDRTDKSSSHLPFVDYRGFLNGPEGEPAYAGEALLGYFTEDTYLSEASYLVLGSVEVVAGATLSISAGTALQFTGNYPLLVEGVLTAQGSETSPISFKPTAVACNDTNSSRSDWQGIEVAAGGVATIEYAEIHCATNGIYFNGGDGSVRNSELLYNSTGIHTYGESAGAHIAPEITGNTIRGGTNGIYVHWNSDPQISGGNVITGNKYGIYARGDLTYATRTPIPVVTGNSLYNNNSHNYYTVNFNYQFSISLDARGNWWGTDNLGSIAQKIYDRTDSSQSHLPFVNYGGYLDGLNGQPAYDGLTLLGAIAEDTVLPAGRHLMLQSLVVEPGVTLTLEAGAILRAAPNQKLQVAGTLVTRGNATSRVVFSPPSIIPAPGEWYGIEVIAGGNVNFDYARVEGAEYGLDFNGGQGIVRNSLFRFNTSGIYVRAGSNPQIGDGNEISLNNYGIFVKGDGSAANNPQPVVTGNSLYGNKKYDLYTTDFGDPTNVSLDVTDNWWGTADELSIVRQIYNSASTSPQVDFSNYREATSSPIAVRLSNVTLTTTKFSPLDGEQAQGGFYLNRAASVTTEIRRHADDSLVYQATENFVQAGEYPISWDGRDTSNALQAEGLYRVVLRASDGFDDFVYDVPQPIGEGSVSGSVPAGYDVYANEFYKISVNVRDPSLVSMQVIPSGESAFYVFEDVFYSTGQHWLYWDGRDPEGHVVESEVGIYYPAPKPLRSTAIYLVRGAPHISGTTAAPNIEVKSDPYRVSHSYEQLTRMAYQVSTNAVVTFSLLPPGIVDPNHPSAIVLVDEQLMSAQDGEGNALLHEVEWRGYNESDPNAVLVGDEGAYIFAIQATSPESGESTLYRGVVNLYR